ncbi:MAG TPA: RDD family protein [Thermoleophilaceae bacterium]
MAEVRIVVVEGPDTGKEFDLSGTTTVGRDAGAGIAIDDTEASRQHASLSVEGTTVTVTDLGSTNGTFVNGERLSGARQLSATDKLRIGTTTFELRVAGADDLQATAARAVPDFAAAPPPSPSMPPPGPPPGGAPAAYAPPPVGAAPPYGGGQPPPYAQGGILASNPNAVPPGAELSGWWRRVGATLLDALISLPFLVFGYILIVSPLLMKREGAQNGQTWGKQALGIRVVRDDQQPFTYGTALLRDFVIKGLLFGAIAVLSLVDSLWPLWDPQNQALHDKLLGTHVLRT